jgi:hypothetical protein
MTTTTTTTKTCRQCRTEIDKQASICPACRSKQPKPPIGLVVAGAVIFLMIVGAGSGGGGGTSSSPSSSSASKSEELSYRVGTSVYGKFSDDPTVGCRTDQLMDRFVGISKVNDVGAVMEMTRRGSCQWISPGTELIVEKMGAFTDNTCARPKGKVDCLWINRGWLRN